MRPIIFVLAIFFSQQARATTWVQLTIEDLVKLSEAVVLVRIESGSMVRKFGHACGAKYKAKVINQFKGKPSQTLVFYDVGGLELGAQYLLFLETKPSPFLGVASTNSHYVSVHEEFARNCKGVARGLRPLHAYGIIKADFSLEIRGDALEVPEMLFFFPSSIQKYSSGLSRTQELDDTVWIKLEDAVAYLYSLNPARAQP